MPQLSQQQQLVLRWVLTVLATTAAAKGLIPQEWADWLNSDATMTVVYALVAFAMLVVGWLKTRPKSVVASAGVILKKEGGVIVAPAKYADSSKTPDNVVKTVGEAAQQLGSGS